MTEMNQKPEDQINQETVDVSFSDHATASSTQEPNPNTVPPVQNPGNPVSSSPKPKKSHPILTVVICALVSLGCGFGGGYLAAKNTGSTTIVYKEAPTSSDTTTTNNTTVTNASMTTTAIAAKAAPSVVEIVTEISQTSYGLFGGTYTSKAAGSGVIISADGYILTNNHVIEDETSITVTTNDGTSYTATVIGSDSKSDIAVIKIDADHLSPATIGDSDSIQTGDLAVVIGNPLGTLGGTVTDGIISATDRAIVINNESMNLIQTNAQINSGNSGGGLFDGNGNLIGIVNAKDSGTTSSGTTIEGLGFAIPINDAMDIAQQLMDSGYVTNRPTLGVYVTTLTQDQGDYKAGVYITDLIAGGGAEAAGLQAYDRIIAINNTEISTYAELTAVLKNCSVGDTVKLTVVRDSTQMDFDVTLSSPIQDSQVVTTPTPTPTPNAHF